MSDFDNDDQDKAGWAKRAAKGVSDSLEFLREHGSELFGKTAAAAGLVASGAYAISKAGFDAATSDIVKYGVAAVVIGYKVYTAVRKEMKKNNGNDPDDGELKADTIPLQDYRDLQSNMDQVLSSHAIIVKSLEQAHSANEEMMEAMDELRNANARMKFALSKTYNNELNDAEQMGLIERGEFRYEEGESIVSMEDAIEDDEDDLSGPQ